MRLWGRKDTLSKGEGAFESVHVLTTMMMNNLNMHEMWGKDYEFIWDSMTISEMKGLIGLTMDPAVLVKLVWLSEIELSHSVSFD